MASGQQGFESVDPQAAVLHWRSCVPPQRQLLPPLDHDQDRGTLSGSTFSSFNTSSASSFSLGSTPSQPQLYGQPVESPVPQALAEAQYEQSPHPAPWLPTRSPIDDPRNPQSQHYHPYEGTRYTHASLLPSKPVSPVHLGLQLRYPPPPPPPPPQSYGSPIAAEGQPFNGGMDLSPEQSPGAYYAPPIPHSYYPRSGMANMPYSTHPQFHLNGHPVMPRPSNVSYQHHPQVMLGGGDLHVQRREKKRSKQPKPYGRTPPVRGRMDFGDEDSEGDYDSLSIPKAVTQQQRIMQSLVDPDGKVRPHQCGECKKRFVRTEHLKRHIKAVHRGIKDFACFLCGKRCSRLDNLRQHLKLHGPRDQSPPLPGPGRGDKKQDDEPGTSNVVKRAPPKDENHDDMD